MSFRPSVLSSDSREYEILYEAAKSIKGVPGLTCEIGLRRGGGSETIVQGCLDNGDPRVHVAIDPYGDIPYDVNGHMVHYDYSNDMRREALPNIYKWMADKGVHFIFMPMEDTEYFQHFKFGLPVYMNQMKLVENDYALVHFDGPHSVEAVEREVGFFSSRAPVGAAWVFDDIDQYSHFPFVDVTVKGCGFELVTRGVCKAWYRKV
jgi:hypothetical protein